MIGTYAAVLAVCVASLAIGQAAIGYIPTDQEWRFVNIYEDTATSMRALVEGTDKTGFSRNEPWKMTGSSLPEHETFFFYLQRICNHCTYPGCLAACPRKAIYKRPEDGIVLIDQNRCRGYKKCVEQCPFKKPMYRGTTRVSEKCIACYPRIEGKDPLTGGEPMETRCMAACVGKIRMQSLMRIGEDGLWAEDRWHPLYYAIRVEQVALPLYPQWGTEPNGFYIPPRHSPRGYARQMFGPGVDNAIEKYLVPSRELLAVLQLWRASQQIIFRYDVIPGPKVFETQIHGKRFEMYNDTVLGFNKSGKEVARIQVEEPIYIRPAERVTDCRDAKDNKYLELALAADRSYMLALPDEAALGIGLVQGFDPAQLETVASDADVFVIGNVILQWPIGWMADHFDRMVTVEEVQALNMAVDIACRRGVGMTSSAAMKRLW